MYLATTDKDALNFQFWREHKKIGLLSDFDASSAAIDWAENFLDFEGTANLLQDGKRNVLALRFREKREQIDLAFLVADQVDHPHATGLSGAWAGPPDLANASGAANDNAGIRMRGDVCGKLASFLFTPLEWPELLKDGAFNNGQHLGTILLRRIVSKLVVV